jgi:hypothetical protein
MCAIRGVNARPLDDTVAGMSPGLPNEALRPGEELPDVLDQE